MYLRSIKALLEVVQTLTPTEQIKFRVPDPEGDTSLVCATKEDVDPTITVEEVMEQLNISGPKEVYQLEILDSGPSTTVYAVMEYTYESGPVTSGSMGIYRTEQSANALCIKLAALNCDEDVSYEVKPMEVYDV